MEASGSVYPFPPFVEYSSSEEKKLPAGEKFLAVVNPYSGSGEALKRFKKEVVPLWQKKGIDFDLFVTEQAGQGAAFVKSSGDLARYTGIIGVGGDGIISEIVQGLMQNSWKKAIKKIAVGHIPCGSGNGLAMSLLHRAKRRYDVKEAAEMIAEGKTSGLDLVELISEEATRYGFLTVSFGLLADLDIESEPCRCLGGNRFILGALMNLLNRKTHFARLSYLPEKETCDALPPLSQPLPRQFVEIKGDFTLILACNTTHCSYNAYTAPSAQLDDGYLLLTFVMHSNRWNLAQILLGMDSGKYLDVPGVQQVKTRAFRLIPAYGDDILTLDGERIPCEPVQCRVLQSALRALAS